MWDFISSAGICFHVALALAGVGCLAFAFKNMAEKARLVGGVTGVCAVFVLVGMMVYAAVKPYTNHTSSDDNIELYEFAAEPIEEELIDLGVTNIIGVTYIIAVSTSSSAPKPIWYRESNAENWTNYASAEGWTTPEPVLDHSDGVTNFYKWVNNVITNEFDHRQWYIGTNLPDVIIDVDDDDVITINQWSMTSKNMKIVFTVADSFEYPEGTVIQVQRAVSTTDYRNKAQRYGEYETIDSIPVATGGLYVWNGFEVGRSTRWRLRITIIEED